MRCVERHVQKERLVVGGHFAHVLAGLSGDQLREILTVLPHLLVVVPQVVGGVVAGPAAIGAPVEDVRIEVDAARQESIPLVEAVAVRSALVCEPEMPLAYHARLVASLAEQ